MKLQAGNALKRQSLQQMVALQLVQQLKQAPVQVRGPLRRAPKVLKTMGEKKQQAKRESLLKRQRRS